MANFLFSSTRQWNPGDEIILFGLRRVFDAVGLAYNPVLYNRHPRIVRDGNKLGEIFDNSFIEGLGRVDYAVLAGTPEWAGKNMDVFYRTVAAQNLRMSAFGIGSTGAAVDKDFREWFMSRADVVVVRDELTRRLLGDNRVISDACPSLFAAPDCVARAGDVRRVGICYQSSGYICSPSADMKAKLDALYKAMIPRYDCTFVCHTYPDLAECNNVFPGANVLYSYDAVDYIGFYRDFDVVVGTRIHGVAVAASWGIPAFYIPHDERAGTVDAFGIPKVSPSSLLDSLGALDVAEVSERMAANRRAAWGRWLGYAQRMVEAMRANGVSR